MHTKARYIGPMLTIHIIDRDPATRLTVRYTLERAGFAVTDADDSTPAPSVPDLVLADPAATSIAVIRRRYPAARVLAMGEDGLRKPFTDSELLAAVRRRLAQPSLV